MSDNKIKCFLIIDTGKSIVEALKGGGSIERTVWRRFDTGEELIGIGKFPVGAMWFAPWLDSIYKPQLAHCLVVKTPGGDWIIDSEASNCTMPAPVRKEATHEIHERKQTDHHCWIIHGIPPEITVDKDGITCEAGAGSIQAGNWHGFLRDGYLVQ